MFKSSQLGPAVSDDHHVGGVHEYEFAQWFCRVYTGRFECLSVIGQGLRSQLFVSGRAEAGLTM